MRRLITRFVTDEAGDWVAELSCGHDQHVRHRPPFQDRPWVVRDETRLKMLGTHLLCPLCDRAELPGRVHFTHESAFWDEATVPVALRHPHHLAEGVWGVVKVARGQLDLTLRGEVVLRITLSEPSCQAIPPGLDHTFEVRDPVGFSIDYFSVEHRLTSSRADRERNDVTFQDGGDSACWAHLLCPICGLMMDGEPHAHDAEPESSP